MAGLIAELIAWCIILAVTFVLTAGGLIAAAVLFTWVFG